MEIVVFALTAILFTGWGFFLYLKNTQCLQEHRYLYIITPVLFYIVFLLYLNHSIHLLNNYWHGARLAFSSSLVHGYNLYYPVDHGPILGMIYGPIAPILWLPAIISASSINMQVILAAWITNASVLIPLFILLTTAHWRFSRNRIVPLAGFLLVSILLYLVQASKYITTWIHVDSAAVGFGIWAASLLMTANGQPSWKRLTLAAVFSFAAAFSKQNEVMIIAAQMIYLYIAFGRKTAVRFLICLVSIGLVISIILLLFYRDQIMAMFLNMVIIPSKHPSQEKGIGFILELAIKSGVKHSLWLVLITWILAINGDILLWYKKRETWRDESAWILLVLTAIIMFPISIIAERKVGGYVNSHHFVCYFIAAVVWVLTHYEMKKISAGKKGIPGLMIAVVVACFALLPLEELSYKSSLRIFKKNPQKQAVEFMHKHPGEAYFPWYPLAALNAEGKLYHFSDGIFSRIIGGQNVTQKHFIENIPEKIKYIIFRKQDHDFQQKDYALQYLPDYRYLIHLEELPDWVVFTNQ